MGYAELLCTVFCVQLCSGYLILLHAQNSALINLNLTASFSLLKNLLDLILA